MNATSDGRRVPRAQHHENFDLFPSNTTPEGIKPNGVASRADTMKARTATAEIRQQRGLAESARNMREARKDWVDFTPSVTHLRPKLATT